MSNLRLGIDVIDEKKLSQMVYNVIYGETVGLGVVRGGLCCGNEGFAGRGLCGGVGQIERGFSSYECGCHFEL
jgi:hypothetical protein